MTIVQFDAFLETVGPGGAVRARAMGIQPEESTRLHETYVELIRFGASKQTIQAALGSPSMQDEANLCYALPSKPGYLFRFRFGASGKLEKANFVSALSDESRTSPGELAKNVERLKAMGATEDEIREWYGEPDQVFEWWPVETWSYGKTHLELRLGIVS